ncbi:MAG TPA: response regulator [Spirochaetota bacterium]|nr:response regulator [Spirochaetota bacterium]HNT10976.1 response regulator [Spirochaetota bacterium]HNV46802.1 response regulator [Spirochaetota bacterium]HOS38368.1 response regulator [Spirochaetota bacterium]HPU90091.1 response regulator [Spirochaetota bacterium]
MRQPKKNRVLIVEDEVITSMDLQSHLQSLETVGEVVIKSTGESALEYAKEMNYDIDLLVMDVNLGKGMNGFQFAKEIHKIKYIPMMVITAYSTTGFDFRELPACGFMSKPIDTDVFIRIIKAILS